MSEQPRPPDMIPHASSSRKSFLKWLLVDRQGNTYPVPLAKHLKSLVKDDGSALIGLSDKDCCIYLRPALIEFQGFAVLTQLLRKAKPKRSLISWYGVDWQYEILPSLPKTIERLIELVLEPQPVDRFYRRPRRIDSLDASHPLSPLIDLWRANGIVDLRRDIEAITNHTNGKYLVVFEDANHRQLKFAQFGRTTWAVYGTNHWMTRCVGQNVENQPDYQYGRWTANGYRDAILACIPTLSDMDTIVSDPATGLERRLQYKRLTLPVRGSDNSTQLLSTSCHDLGVSLRPPID